MKLRKARVLRDDIRGVLRAPKQLQEFLLRIGGYTPFGEAMYRIEWAENIYDQQGGIWSEWPEDMPVKLRCWPRQPLRVVTELRDVQKYPGMVGWIVERWEPAAFFGGKEAWESAKVPDTDIPFLGPLHDCGRYQHVSGPSVSLPTTSDLKAAVEQVEWNKDQHSGAVERAMTEALNEAVYQYEEEGRRLRERTEAVVRDVLSPWNSSSLAAGRWRSEVAERAGIREHAGN